MATEGKALLFALLRNEIGGQELTEETKNLISKDSVEEVFRLAKAHDLAHLVSDALIKNGLLDKDTVPANAFLRQQQTAVFRYEQLRFEYERICEALEAAEIEYMPLKGSVLRAYYPEPWMRTSCDIDIYVQKKDLDKATRVLAEKLEYRNEGTYTHDVSMYALCGVHLELHFELVEDFVDKRVAAVLRRLWKNSKKKEGGKQRYLTNEDFYFYHVAHMAKHFKNGGCGIRPFLDLHIMKKNMPCDESECKKLLEEGGLSAFFGVAEKLCGVWFDEEEHDEITRRMEAFVFNGDAYGNIDNRMKVSLERKSKVRYLFSRFFPPYANMKAEHPSIGKFPPLYLFFAIKRWFNLIFVPGRAKKSLQELGKVKKYETDENARILFEKIGL